MHNGDRLPIRHSHVSPVAYFAVASTTAQQAVIPNVVDNHEVFGRLVFAEIQSDLIGAAPCSKKWAVTQPDSAFEIRFESSGRSTNESSVDDLLPTKKP